MLEPCFCCILLLPASVSSRRPSPAIFAPLATPTATRGRPAQRIYWNGQPRPPRPADHRPAQRRQQRSAKSHNRRLPTQWVGAWGGRGGASCRPPADHEATPHPSTNRRRIQFRNYCPQLVPSANARNYAQQAVSPATSRRSQASATQSTPVSVIAPRGFTDTVGGGMEREGRHKAQTTHRAQRNTAH
jgi:hypothetical protein